MNGRTRLERIRRWRQAAVWAPVFWFLVILTGFALSHFAVVLTLALVGFVLREFVAPSSGWVAVRAATRDSACPPRAFDASGMPRPVMPVSSRSSSCDAGTARHRRIDRIHVS